jgi:DNA-binding NarL/FixJ family response regulator
VDDRQVSESMLTETSRIVLVLSARGLFTSEVADQLGLPAPAVRAEMCRAMKVLGAHSKLEAIVRAARLGLIDLSDWA